MRSYIKSVGGDSEKVIDRIFKSDFDTTWQAVLESLKSSPLEISNRESGYIRTKWIDNTDQKNFVDSFGPGKAYLKAQHRFRVTVSQGTFDRIPAVRVAVQKEQMVQYDILEGWRPVVSDEVDEETLLYRVGRIIFVRMKIAKADEEKSKEELKESGF